ncbi:hypothetical protein J2I47_15525 [Fibrella sp. HMF5335]|uniref:Uncharacterized protein n=1 Tax=Fibrella rubiginis TaxID=2817060 RepID=A0A939GGK9_9BACT|nr:hypothetical protein [Fibrella rubiginis]MBO0937966.1 hypothetical protein [Fibrella rubiginis]
MKLTHKQLIILNHDLYSRVNIKYDHLGEELLDHYATLTEEKMAAGQSFYEASTTAWQELGDGTGIRQIQDDYEAVTKKQVRARHVAIMKSYFRWPMVIATVLVSAILGTVYSNLPADLAKIINYLFVFLPAAVMLAAWIPYYRNKDSRQKLVWRYISNNGSWPVNMANLFLIMTDNERILVPFTTHLSVTALLAGGVLFQAICLAELTRETFYYKPVF